MEKGFRAYTQVYDEVIYVNTFTGEGFDKVLKKMDPLLRKLSSKVFIEGYAFEDIKNEITILVIEGIKSFDPDRNVKLSTFLQAHLHNKIISWIRSENKQSNDAFSLQEKNDGNLKKVRGEINFGQFDFQKNGDPVSFENLIPDDGGLTPVTISDYDLVNFETDLLKISSRLDPKTRKIIELVYFKDYSIKDAAEAVGLSGWAASMRLKKLASRGIFKTIFE